MKQLDMLAGKGNPKDRLDLGLELETHSKNLPTASYQRFCLTELYKLFSDSFITSACCA